MMPHAFPLQPELAVMFVPVQRDRSPTMRWLFARSVLTVTVAVVMAACGRKSPTAPTGHTAPAAPAAVAAFGLVGGVSDTAGHPLGQARVEVLDGPQKGTLAATDDAGAFAFGTIFTSAFTLRASKEGRLAQSRVISGARSDGFF